MAPTRYTLTTVRTKHYGHRPRAWHRPKGAKRGAPFGTCGGRGAVRSWGARERRRPVACRPRALGLHRTSLGPPSFLHARPSFMPLFARARRRGLLGRWTRGGSVPVPQPSRPRLATEKPS